VVVVVVVVVDVVAIRCTRSSTWKITEVSIRWRRDILAQRLGHKRMLV
jgi:hypothetical protein